MGLLSTILGWFEDDAPEPQVERPWYHEDGTLTAFGIEQHALWAAEERERAQRQAVLDVQLEGWRAARELEGRRDLDLERVERRTRIAALKRRYDEAMRAEFPKEAPAPLREAWEALEREDALATEPDWRTREEARSRSDAAAEREFNNWWGRIGRADADREAEEDERLEIREMLFPPPDSVLEPDSERCEACGTVYDPGHLQPITPSGGGEGDMRMVCPDCHAAALGDDGDTWRRIHYGQD